MQTGLIKTHERGAKQLGITTQLSAETGRGRRRGGGALLKLNVLVDCSSASKACNSKDVILKGIPVDG